MLDYNVPTDIKESKRTEKSISSESKKPKKLNLSTPKVLQYVNNEINTILQNTKNTQIDRIKLIKYTKSRLAGLSKSESLISANYSKATAQHNPHITTVANVGDGIVAKVLMSKDVNADLVVRRADDIFSRAMNASPGILKEKDRLKIGLDANRDIANFANIGNTPQAQGTVNLTKIDTVNITPDALAQFTNTLINKNKG